MSKKNASKHIKGRFGQWLLVELSTGRWSAVWGQFEGLDAFDAIVCEDQSWFDAQMVFARPDVQDTQIDAIRVIVSELTRQRDKSSEAERSMYADWLKLAQSALAKCAVTPHANCSMDDGAKQHIAEKVQGENLPSGNTLASIISWIEQEHGRKVLAIMPSVVEVEPIGETYWVVFGYGERRSIEWVVGLKSISEESGPVAEDCPPSLFALAPEVNSKWRLKCLKNFVRR